MGGALGVSAELEADHAFTRWQCRRGELADRASDLPLFDLSESQRLRPVLEPGHVAVGEPGPPIGDANAGEASETFAERTVICAHHTSIDGSDCAIDPAHASGVGGHR